MIYSCLKSFIMKKYFYLLAAGLLLFFAGRAQIKKGELLLGGNLGFQKQDNSPVAPNYSDATFISVVPSFGKAIRDNLVVGVNLTYGYTKLVQSDGFNPQYTLKYWNYGLVFFIRRYKDLGHNFSIFLEGDLGGGYILQKGSFEGSNGLYVDMKGYNISTGLSGGIAYNITHRWQVETGFRDLAYASYGHDKQNGSMPSLRKDDGIMVGTNLNRALNNFSIGCRYILN